MVDILSQTWYHECLFNAEKHTPSRDTHKASDTCLQTLFQTLMLSIIRNSNSPLFLMEHYRQFMKKYE